MRGNRDIELGSSSSDMIDVLTDCKDHFNHKVIMYLFFFGLKSCIA